MSEAPKQGPTAGGEALERLLARAHKGMSLGLDASRRALRALGDPHLSLRVAHVAGSNGKGSTCAMLDSIARAAGLRVGVYTSPHLCRFAERIAIDGAPLDDLRLQRSLETVLDRGGGELTLFETITAAAFHAFAEAEVDLVVLEVGLGGRLDATNVVERPLTTAITSIALEHTALLGSTLGAIAREKAGIFKRGCPAVLGPLAPEALSAARDVLSEIEAGPGLRVGPGESDAELRWKLMPAKEGRPELVEFLGPDLQLRARLGLEGSHQHANACVAVGMALQLEPHFPGLANHIPEGLERARWAGRLERIQVPVPGGLATVLLDAAHNPHGMETLVSALDRAQCRPQTTKLLFGALADKDFEPMLRALAPRMGSIVYTQPKGRAPAPLGELVAIAPGDAIGEPSLALRRALEALRPGELLVITGSIYLVGELRGLLLGLPCDPVVAL